MTPFDAITSPVNERVAAGLGRVALALKTNSWREAHEEGVSPTQAQILACLRAAPNGLRAGELALRLALSPATVSEALRPLMAKELVCRVVDPHDRRAARLTVTPEGAAIAARTAEWPDALLAAIDDLDADERAVLFRALVKMIRGLQRRGEIPIQKMCVSCTHFRANVHADPEQPHHCALIGAAFGDRHLRLDCPEQEPADETLQLSNWARFIDRAA